VEQKYNATLSLTSLLDGVGGHWHAPNILPPGKTPGTLCTGGWVGPRDGLDGWRKSRSHRDSIPGPSNLYRPVKPTATCLYYNEEIIRCIQHKGRCVFAITTIISRYTTHFVSQFFKVQVFKAKGKGTPMQN